MRRYARRVLKVFSAGNEPEAQLVIDMLHQHDIPARAFNRMLRGTIEFGPALDIEIYIERDADGAEAARLIEEFEARRDQEVDRELECASCGETSPGNFELCWSCGAELPSNSHPYRD